MPLLLSDYAFGFTPEHGLLPALLPYYKERAYTELECTAFHRHDERISPGGSPYTEVKVFAHSVVGTLWTQGKGQGSQNWTALWVLRAPEGCEFKAHIPNSESYFYAEPTAGRVLVYRNDCAVTIKQPDEFPPEEKWPEVMKYGNFKSKRHFYATHYFVCTASLHFDRKPTKGEVQTALEAPILQTLANAELG